MICIASDCLGNMKRLKNISPCIKNRVLGDYIYICDRCNFIIGENQLQKISQQNDTPGREHPAVSNGKSAKEIQDGYRRYLRAHRGR